MNQLGIGFVWSALQVTVFLLVALPLLARLSGRRFKGGVITACLVGCVALTLLACCSLPASWSWDLLRAQSLDRSHPHVDGSPPTTGEFAAGPAEAPSLPPGHTTSGWWDLLARGLAHAARPDLAPGPDATWHWSGILAVILLAGIAWSVLRLLIALAAVRRWHKCSRPIADAALLDLVEVLRREMGCRLLVEVRESPDLHTAATVGWRKPLLLLPPAWPTWHPSERRAVIAHEIAHVRRSDYVTWLVARFSVALHFYHPLVHWLAGRLQLQQELAADDLAARHAGGRSVYLRALAGLALRQDMEPLFAPVRAFLPAPGTLMRRIAMLRKQEEARPLSPLGRTLTAAVLVISLFAISAVRGPARAPADDGVPVPVKAAETADPGLELFYAPPGLSGVSAVRPSELFKLQGMKEQAPKINREVAVNCKAMGIGSLPLLEEIELATCGIIFRTDLKQPKGQRHSMLLSFFAVRTVRDYDWKGLMHSMAPKATEVKYAGRVYFKGGEPSNLLISLGPDQCFYFPDARTVIVDTEKNLRAWFDAGAQPSVAPVGAEDWKKVRSGLFAVALDNRGNRYGKDRGSDETPPPAVASLLENTSHLVFGLSGREELRFDIYGRWPEGSSAEKLTEAAEATAALLKKEMKAIDPNSPDAKKQQEVRALWNRLLNAGRIERKKDAVHAHSAAKMTLLEAMQVLEGF